MKAIARLILPVMGVGPAAVAAVLVSRNVSYLPPAVLTVLGVILAAFYFIYAGREKNEALAEEESGAQLL